MVLFVKRFCALSLLFLLANPLHSRYASASDTVAYIQICLIVDVSGSMEGLLYQAQTQIWNVLDYASQHQKKKKQTVVELALISVGNGMLNADPHFVEVLSDFSTDRDRLADKLFLLRANGAVEMFPEATQRALNTLSWREEAAMKTIIIAGNEEFEQGQVKWQDLTEELIQRKIPVITLFCGDAQLAEEFGWFEASTATKGAYTTISKDAAKNTITPFDKHIVSSYLKYLASYNDSSALKMKEKLPKQQISPAYRDLMLYRFANKPKAKDVIDVFDESGWDFNVVTPEMLSPELKALSERELKQYLVKKAQERANSRDAVSVYKQKVDEYLTVKEDELADSPTLDEALRELIGVQLKELKFKKVD